VIACEEPFDRTEVYMSKRETGKKVALGICTGAAGTALIQGMMAGAKRFAPETLAPVKEDPGRFMVKQAERLLPESAQNKVPETAEAVTARALAFGYGITFATLYTLARPRTRSVLAEGTALGILTWAAGYLGWLPAVKLMPPVWKQEIRQVAPNVLSHALFGIACVALSSWARRRM
jgi:hypothetical protein